MKTFTWHNMWFWINLLLFFSNYSENSIYFDKHCHGRCTHFIFDISLIMKYIYTKESSSNLFKCSELLNLQSQMIDAVYTYLLYAFNFINNIFFSFCKLMKKEHGFKKNMFIYFLSCAFWNCRHFVILDAQ